MFASLRKWICVFSIYACLLSCKDGGYTATNKNTPSHVEVKKEIPADKEGELDQFYIWIKQNASELGIDSLELGYDSLQFRIWLGHSMAVKRHLIIFKVKNHKWRGQLINFTETDDLHIDTKDIDQVTPGSGWKQFEKKLNDLQIIQSLTEQDLNRHDGCGGADGMHYYFEIATLNKYRFLHHCYPDGKIIQFTTYLEKELDFEFTK